MYGLCPPHTLVKVGAGLRAEEVVPAGWACTITCSELHKQKKGSLLIVREKSRRLGWVALTTGPVNIIILLQAGMVVER